MTLLCRCIRAVMYFLKNKTPFGLYSPHATNNISTPNSINYIFGCSCRINTWGGGGKWCLQQAPNLESSLKTLLHRFSAVNCVSYEKPVWPSYSPSMAIESCLWCIENPNKRNSWVGMQQISNFTIELVHWDWPDMSWSPTLFGLCLVNTWKRGLCWLFFQNFCTNTW